MKFVMLLVTVITAVSSVISFIYKYLIVYKIGGIFLTRKFAPAKNQHKYAVLIAARNEENVIGNLIDSIREQDYPSELVDIFVVADNCTDNTARIARENGAVCYERFDSEHRTKGFALQFLVEQIRRDYGIEAFEGYFIFDADNLLKGDFISRMNDSFDAGEKVVTSYRNTKNFSDNWISASYGVHWLRTIRYEHRTRSFLRLATRIQGTGFLFANELIRDGWNYTSLTEDRAFCADAVAKGYAISYNNKAEFYDEQPVSLRIAMRQRIRWSRGHIEAFAETGPKLFYHIFITRGVKIDKIEQSKKPLSAFMKIVYNLRFRFMSLDILTNVFPHTLFTTLKRVTLVILRSILIVGGLYSISLKLMPEQFYKITEHFGVTKADLPTSPVLQIILLAVFTLSWAVFTYLKSILCAAYVYIFEYKRIEKIPIYKIIWFCLTFPIFDVMGRIANVIAMFGKVEWKPIPHNVNVSAEKMKHKIKK